MSKTQKLTVPEGATEVNVVMGSAHYPLKLEFNDPKETVHYFMENAEYDGYCHQYVGTRETEHGDG